MLYHNFSLVFPGRIGYNVLQNNGWKNGKEEPDMIRRMFSLIELLITVAVIAILAGLLLPALNSARQKGQAIRCVSNLKQQGNCHSLYAADFDDWIISQEGVFGGYKCTWWRMFRLLGYTGESLKNFQALRNDAAQESIFCCPSGSFRTEWAPFDLWSYGLNGHLAGVEGSGSLQSAESSSVQYRARFGDLLKMRRKASDAPLGADATFQYFGSWVNRNADPFLGTNASQYRLCIRHLGRRTNFLYADLHVVAERGPFSAERLNMVD